MLIFLSITIIKSNTSKYITFNTTKFLPLHLPFYMYTYVSVDLNKITDTHEETIFSIEIQRYNFECFKNKNFINPINDAIIR